MLNICEADTGVTLKVMLIEESASPNSILKKTLANEGYEILIHVSYQADIFHRASNVNPDIIVVSIIAPDRDMLSQLKYINDIYPKPIVIFSQQGDSEIINSAVSAGVSAFIVDGLSENRIKPVLDVALARFNNYTNLRNELEQTKQNLANRKIIEKAKGLIMKQKNCSEDEAYNLLRKLAMDRNQKLIDVAKNIMELSSLLL